jgi:predicted kinase
MAQQVIILSGVSGAGKSSVAAGIEGILAVSADHYFMAEGEYRFDSSKLGEAHGFCFREFVRLLQAGRSVVVDNTNTTAIEIAPYVLGAQAYGYECRIVTVVVPESRLHIAAQRNRHGVSLDVIRAQFDRLQRRELPPWWAHETVAASI